MKKIDTLIEQMTLEEKAALCIGASAWTTVEIERLGIPSIWVSDGPHGLRKVENEEEIGKKSVPATCFPTASCQASTWNTALIKKMGEALAEEAHALNVDVVLGPGANIKRTPLCGRNFEYYSEDPVLSGEMAASLIEGLQGKGVGASLKHFVANNQEYQRFSISAEVDERTLREIYLRSFEIAVKKAKPWTVMCAYNKLNGEYCSEHHELLVDILKEEWGFEGFVVSDWGAVHDRVKALKGGVDLEMPGAQPLRLKALMQAVESGECDIKVLDEAVRRLLEIIFKSQEVSGNETFDPDAHHKMAREIASEGIVLLKNDGLLPLKDQKRIAVIGHSAKEPYYQGGGSSHINPIKLDNPLAELQKLAGGAELVFAQGYTDQDILNQELIDEAVKVAEDAEVALLFIALPSSKESEGYDRPDLDLTKQQINLIQAVARVQANTVVILNSGSAITMQPWLDQVGAVMQAWMMGQAGAGAIADVLFGKVNPSGKLAETFPFALEDTPAHINYPGEGGKVRYGEGLFVGYRYYEAKNMPVQFPFGYGLSYTNFEYSNPQVADKFDDIDGLAVSVDVTNTGEVAGNEIVQVYVHDHQATLSRPHKELKGFAKVDLAPGETKTVTIPLGFRAFAFYHPEHHTWITEDGDFDILIGASSQDIRHVLTTSMASTLKLPSLLDHESTIKEWLADPRGMVVIKPMFDQIQAQFAQLMGEGEEGIGLDAITMIGDMPLASVMMWNQSAFPKPVDQIVDEMLQLVHEQG
jgi:beta-glucosidase